ncbi:MAG: type II secretion system GspH family protein [Planctomycetaceae bacterium]|nr:type II secretion system GspH family protein [Planctomycetaceae bacterium]
MHTIKPKTKALILRSQVTSPNQGFTLIELLVVIAIIALLLSVVLPSLNRVKEYSRRTICATNLRTMATWIALYAQSSNDYIPPLTDRYPPSNANYDDQKSNHYDRWWRILEDATPTWSYWNLGLLYKAGLAETGEVFFCPSKLAEYKYNDYATPSFPTDMAIGSTGIRIPYAYNPMCKSLTDRHRRFRTLGQFSAGGPLIVDLLSTQAPTHLRGWNVARTDASVDFRIDHSILDDLRGSTDIAGKDYETYDRILFKLR